MEDMGIVAEFESSEKGSYTVPVHHIFLCQDVETGKLIDAPMAKLQDWESVVGKIDLSDVDEDIRNDVMDFMVLEGIDVTKQPDFVKLTYASRGEGNHLVGVPFHPWGKIVEQTKIYGWEKLAKQPDYWLSFNVLLAGNSKLFAKFAVELAKQGHSMFEALKNTPIDLTGLKEWQKVQDNFKSL